MSYDDPRYLSKYSHDNDLINKPGWKQLQLYVKKTKNMNRLLNTSKTNQRRNTVKIKFGMKIYLDHKNAMMFDADNLNTNWKDSELLEQKKIYNFNPFESLVTVNKSHILPGHTKIQVRIIYNYKQNDMYKARMVESGNTTGNNIDTYYYRVISLRSIITVVFLSELNNIETCTGDTSNAYMTAQTNDDILFKSKPKFAPFGHTGHLLIINNVLYGLKSYGVRFHSQLSDDLKSPVLIPSMGGCDIWMRNKGDY